MTGWHLGEESSDWPNGFDLRQYGEGHAHLDRITEQGKYTRFDRERT